MQKATTALLPSPSFVLFCCKDFKSDLNRWKWVKKVQLLDYTTKQGREQLKRYEALEKGIRQKWENVLTMKVKL
jgi:hypothetical protein